MILYTQHEASADFYILVLTLLTDSRSGSGNWGISQPIFLIWLEAPIWPWLTFMHFYKIWNHKICHKKSGIEFIAASRAAVEEIELAFCCINGREEVAWIKSNQQLNVLLNFWYTDTFVSNTSCAWEKQRWRKKMILIVIVKVEKFKMHFDQTVGDFLNFYSFFLV